VTALFKVVLHQQIKIILRFPVSFSRLHILVSEYEDFYSLLSWLSFFNTVLGTPQQKAENLTFAAIYPTS
jgi:hypothetical protein